MDHPLPAPITTRDALIRPWRTAAYVAGAMALVELALLLVIGGARLTGAVSERVEHAARERVLAQAATPDRLAHAQTFPAAKLPRKRTVVLVLNGNGRTGAAASAATRVKSRGYRVGAVGNAPRRVANSIVMYRAGYAGEGRRLGRDLRVRLVGPLDGMRAGALRRAHVVLIVGS